MRPGVQACSSSDDHQNRHILTGYVAAWLEWAGLGPVESWTPVREADRTFHLARPVLGNFFDGRLNEAAGAADATRGCWWRQSADNGGILGHKEVPCDPFTQTDARSEERRVG